MFVLISTHISRMANYGQSKDSLTLAHLYSSCDHVVPSKLYNGLPGDVLEVLPVGKTWKVRRPSLHSLIPRIESKCNSASLKEFVFIRKLVLCMQILIYESLVIVASPIAVRCTPSVAIWNCPTLYSVCRLHQDAATAAAVGSCGCIHTMGWCADVM